MAKICLVFIVAIFSKSLALHLGAFNVQIFGKTKFSRPDVVSLLTKIVQRYDIVLIQEIRDASETVIYDFVEVLNNQSAYTYNVVVGPRLGRSTSKEQYAYIYRNETVQILGNYTHLDNGDVFERDPFVVHIRDLTANCTIPDLVLIGVHIKPGDVPAELDGMVKAYETAVDTFNTSHVILLGDMNADCQYLKDTEHEQLKITTDDRFVWLINKTVDTTVAASSCAYDRFAVTLSIRDLVREGSVRVFRFDDVCGLNATQAKRVSDHYPIELQLACDKYCLTIYVEPRRHCLADWLYSYHFMLVLRRRTSHKKKAINTLAIILLFRLAISYRRQ